MCANNLLHAKLPFYIYTYLFTLTHLHEHNPANNQQFKPNLKDLNQDFFFFLTSWHTKVKEARLPAQI